jgi:HSP20 family protein
MSNETKKRGLFLTVIVLVLIVVVGVQTAVMYYALTKNETSQILQVPQGDAIIRPRLNAPVQQYSSQAQPMVNSMSQNQSLRPPPLPKLNLNLNALSGVKPIAQQQQQTVQAQRPVLSSQRGGGMNRMMRGVSGRSGMNIKDEVDRMRRMMDSMFSNQGMSAAMNRHSNARGLSMRAAAPTLTQNGNNFIVKLTISGLDKSEINAQVNNNILTLSGVQKEETENNSQYGRSYSSSSRSFQNSFSLPGPIKSDGMKVDYENNILTVTVPKA